VGDTPTPFGTQYSGFFRRYAVRKGWYAVRRNSVISYADIIFYFKKVQFSSRNTTHVTYPVQTQITQITIFLRARLFWVMSAFINLNIDFGMSKSRKFNKQTHQS